jgi:hypothetical protein
MSMTGFVHEVAWGEFEKLAPADRQAESAYIKVKFLVPFRWRRSGREFRVASVEATCFVVRTESWVVQDRQTDELLVHEQGHYDITTLGMREAANLAMEATARSERQIKRRVKAIIDAVDAKVDAANARYDIRTEHSRDPADQRLWLGSIRRAKEDENGTVDDLPE